MKTDLDSFCYLDGPNVKTPWYIVFDKMDICVIQVCCNSIVYFSDVGLNHLCI